MQQLLLKLQAPKEESRAANPTLVSRNNYPKWVSTPSA
jgi:hypothetical protein